MSAVHDDTEILGVVLLARHGDRRGFYQDPLTYTPSQTSITPLGEVRILYNNHNPRLTQAAVDRRVPARLLPPVDLRQPEVSELHWARLVVQPVTGSGPRRRRRRGWRHL